ncbi:MAG: YbjQ family protein [Pseudomonadota bacterium]
MILTNTETVPGYTIETSLGLVQGTTVRAKHVGRDITAALKNIIGGELGSYTSLMSEARAEAIERLKSEARMLGADGVVNIRLGTAAISSGAAEILAYGTAVKLSPVTKS